MVRAPEPEPMPVTVIRFTIVGWVNGQAQFFVEGTPCFTIQFAYSLTGPWYDAADGIEGQPVVVTPPAEGSPRYYRAVWRQCPEPVEE